MINVGNLLDACGISYTDKLLVKLDKLIDELLNELSLQQFDSNQTKQENDFTLDSEDKSRKHDFENETKLKPFQHCIPEFEFKTEFKSEPNYDNTIKEEIQEESAIEIKKEFPIDPFASLDTFNNSEDVREIANENYNHNPENTDNTDNFPIKRNKCLICHKKFLRKAELKRHTDSVHEGKRPHKCSICDKSCSLKAELKAHIESVHEKKKPYKCSICGYSCSTNGNLKTHIESVHEKKKHKCSICDYSFSQKSSLRRHTDSVHAINKQHKCPICDFSCSLQDSLMTHIESVHGKKKPHLCSICEYSCSQKGNLKRHIESVHEKKKPHKCSYCDHAFFEKSKLNSHIVSVHEMLKLISKN